jgi:hypothetical protein
MVSTEFLEDFAAHLDSSVFTRTFSFSCEQLPALDSPTSDLADRVILVAGIGVIIHLAEHQGGGKTKGADLQKWFATEVSKAGMNRIRKTRDLIHSYAGVSLVNASGHRVSVSADDLHDAAGLILHRTGKPKGHSPPRFRKSRVAGFVHIMSDREYYGLAEYLVTPSELVDYLKFRQDILSRPFPVPANVSEDALLGQYLFEELDAPPDPRYETAGRSFRGDPNSWVFSYVIDNLSSQMAKRDDEIVETVYQRILEEVALLRRPELREFKTQLRLALEAVRGDRFELPYRLTSKTTECGFLVLPGSAEFRLRAREALESLAVASKHELGLERQVSIAMWRSGEIIDIDWLYTEGPNPPDEKLDERLKRFYPFRRTSEQRNPV